MKMFLQQHVESNAHANSIWCCDAGVWRNGTVNGELTDIEIIVTGSVDESVKIWIMDGYKVILHKQLVGHTLGILSVALNSEATMCASSSMDANLILWDTQSGDQLTTLTMEGIELWSIIFSPDGRHIVTGSHSSDINVIDIEKMSVVGTMASMGSFTISVACSATGQYVAAGSTNGIVSIFDLEKDSEKASYSVSGSGMPVRATRFTPDSIYLLAGSDDGYVRIYAVEFGEQFANFKCHEARIFDIDITLDRRFFATACGDGSIRFWRFEDQSCVGTLAKSHTKQVWGLRFLCNDTKLVSVSEDRSLVIYKRRPNK